MALDSFATLFTKSWFRTRAGSPVGAVTPKFGGDQPEFVFDTTNNAMYFASGSANTDWVQLAAASSGSDIVSTQTLELTDDEAGTIVSAVNADSAKTAIISSNTASSTGFVRFRGTDGAVVKLAGDANFDVVTNTALTGTSGADGNTTVSYNSGSLYIENREGLTLTYRVTIL